MTVRKRLKQQSRELSLKLALARSLINANGEIQAASGNAAIRDTLAECARLTVEIRDALWRRGPIDHA